MDTDRAAAAKEAHASGLMADPAVLAVGVGTDEQNRAAVTIYVETGRTHGFFPSELDGVPTQIIRTDLIRAYGWNEPQSETAGKACSIRSR